MAKTSITTIPVDGPFDFLSTKDAVVDKIRDIKFLIIEISESKTYYQKMILVQCLYSKSIKLNTNTIRQGFMYITQCQFRSIINLKPNTHLVVGCIWHGKKWK